MASSRQKKGERSIKRPFSFFLKFFKIISEVLTHFQELVSHKKRYFTARLTVNIATIVKLHWHC